MSLKSVIFSVQCRGRDASYKEVLGEPVLVEVHIRALADEKTIATEVRCPFNTGSHGHRCKASHPESEQAEEDVTCPYVLDIPTSIDVMGAQFGSLSHV